MNPPHTVASTLAYVAAAFTAAGFDEARRRARRLLAAALRLTLGEVFIASEREIAEAERQRVADILRRALAHEPLSRIEGRREFWGLDFALSPSTLDPRPETETVVEAVLARLGDRDRPYRFLDLGTGSGCLLLALLKEYQRATGIGVDRAEDAIATARRNASRLDLADRASFTVGDWGRGQDAIFDVVVSNPPYIPTADIAGLAPEVRDFDPLLALDGGIDGLGAYRAIASDLPRLLTPDGLFACEVGAGQAEAVAGLLAGHGLAVDAVVPDLAGLPRCVVARPMPRLRAKD